MEESGFHMTMNAQGLSEELRRDIIDAFPEYRSTYLDEVFERGLAEELLGFLRSRAATTQEEFGVEEILARYSQGADVFLGWGEQLSQSHKALGLYDRLQVELAADARQQLRST